MYAKLFSNGINYGSSYLEHIIPELPSLLERSGRSADHCHALFIPWAGHKYDDMLAYTQHVCSVFQHWQIESVHRCELQHLDLSDYDLILVNGGNTYRLVKKLQDTQLMNKIAQAVREEQCCYAGWSAGANIAAPELSTTNDMPICWPASPQCLQLIHFQINPHYCDPNPKSKHQGETTEERLLQYLEEEKSRPVLALREGSWIELMGDEHTPQSYSLAGKAFKHDYMQGDPPLARWFDKGGIQELWSIEDFRAALSGLLS